MKQPAFADRTRQENMAMYVDCWGDPYTGEEHTYDQTGKKHAATDNVLAKMACGSVTSDVLI